MPEDSEETAGKRRFSILTQSIEGVPVVQVYGEVDIATVPRLRGAIYDALAGDGYPEALVLDLVGTEFFDSSGVGLLIEQRRELLNLGTALGIVVREGPVLHILKTTGLDQTLPLYAEPAAAAKSLTGE